MAYDIRLAKLINGDIILAKFKDEKFTEPAIVQTIPTEAGVQMMLLPFGYPFEQEFNGEIGAEHVLYEYKSCPEELKNKYIEATSNITLASSNTLNKLSNLAAGAQGKGGLSGLIKK